MLPADHAVVTEGGERIAYRKLLIATGGVAKSLDLPGATLAGVHRVRNRDDADAVRAAAAGAKRAVVVGGSFLGLEIAATLTAMGVATVMLERGASLMPRLCAPEISAFLLQHCVARGLDFMPGTSVTAFEGDASVRAVVTATGARLPCDLVVLCVGIAPAVGFLADSGIALDNGIVVDERLRTNLPDIYAAGDVANFYDPVFAKRRRLEHEDNALKQGRLAAHNMMGANLPWDALSYFYSDVFDLSFDVLGAVEEGETRIARGTLDSRSFGLFYMRNDVVRALFSLGRPADEITTAEGLIRHRTNLAAIEARLPDSGFALKDVPSQTVLILQGGGALGAFECGVVRALEEAAIFPEIVAGVSIGAFNGAIVASHPRHAAEALEAFWNDLAVDTPDLFQRDLTRAAVSMQILTLGVPNFFKPRWLSGGSLFGRLTQGFTSFYDTSPIRDLIARYVDFPKLKASPVRLVVSAVDVETSELRTFDSYIDDLTPDHILASGSLPPGFPWTPIDGRSYWDGGIISNTPLDLVIDHCGAAGKRVFIVDLFAGRKPMPKNLGEVLARRDEIVFAERIRNDEKTRDLIQNFRALVDEIMEIALGADAMTRLKSRPRYVQLMGDTAPMMVTRIVREGEAGEPSSRDYDFSRASIRQNRAEGHRLTKETLAKNASPALR